MISMLRAYSTYPGKDPYESGCLLVFSESPGKARMIGCDHFSADFIEMTAKRVKTMDQYANLREGKAWAADSNDDLPNGIKFYAEVEYEY